MIILLPQKHYSHISFVVYCTYRSLLAQLFCFSWELMMFLGLSFRFYFAFLVCFVIYIHIINLSPNRRHTYFL